MQAWRPPAGRIAQKAGCLPQPTFSQCSLFLISVAKSDVQLCYSGTKTILPARFSAVTRKDYISSHIRSWSLSICPGYTFVSSGSTSSRSRTERTRSLMLPVGRSVLPTEARNSVSPLKSTRSSEYSNSSLPPYVPACGSPGSQIRRCAVPACR